MLEIFRLVGRLVLDKQQFDQDAKSADSTGKNLSDNLGGYFEKVKKILKGLATAAAIKKVASAVWDLAKTTSQAGDRIDKQSQALGLSRKGYQEWDYILRQSGADIDSLGMAMRTMNETISGNSAETASALSTLGLSAAHLQSLSPEEQFEEIVKALQKLPPGAEKSRLAMQLLGRNAQSLMPLLNSSADSVEQLRQRAHDLGLIMSDEDVDASVAFGDALDDLNAVWGALKNKFGAQLLPAFTTGLIAAANALGRISNAVEDAFVTGDWSGVFSTINQEISSLIPGLVDFIVGAVNGLFENADEVVGIAVNIITGITNGVVNALPVLIEKLPSIVNTIWEGLKSIVTNLGNLIIDQINAVFGTNIPSFDVIVDWVQNKWQDVQNAITTVKEWVGDTAHKIAVAWKSTVDEWTQTIGDWLSGKITFKDLALKFTSTVDGWIKKIAQWLRSVGLGAVVDFGATVADWISKIGEWIDNTTTEIGLNIGATVSKWIETIYDWVTNGIRVVVSFFDSGNTVSPTGNGSRPDQESVMRQVSNMSDADANAWLSSQGMYYNTGTNSFEWIPRASGLNYVPYDGYRASLHRGEAVLNQNQSREWRQNSGFNAERLYSTVASAVAEAVSGISVNMDGKSVGTLVAKQVSRTIYNQQVGRRYAT